MGRARLPGFGGSRSGGFTLIELMIVVVVIGILAAIAYPSYQEHVRKARRADAQTALLELAQFMERHYTANGKYLTSANAAPTLPFSEAPKDGTGKYYDLSFASAPQNRRRAHETRSVPFRARSWSRPPGSSRERRRVPGRTHGRRLRPPVESPTTRSAR
jgi:prepilin-type N-terminal cleavage/methylation domain-containing protein